VECVRVSERKERREDEWRKREEELLRCPPPQLSPKMILSRAMPSHLRCVLTPPPTAPQKEEEEKNERGGWCGREGLTGLGERRVLSYRDWVMRHRGKKKLITKERKEDQKNNEFSLRTGRPIPETRPSAPRVIWGLLGAREEGQLGALKASTADS